MKFTGIRDRCEKYSIEMPATAVSVFKLVQRKLHIMGEQGELLVCMNRVNAGIASSRTRSQPLERDISMHPAEPESVRAEVSPLVVSIDVVHCQPSTAQMAAAPPRPRLTRVALSLSLKPSSVTTASHF